VFRAQVGVSIHREGYGDGASVMRSSSARMKGAMDWLRATDWDAIGKIPQLE
jgi:hypothetical protein